MTPLRHPQRLRRYPNDEPDPVAEPIVAKVATAGSADSRAG